MLKVFKNEKLWCAVAGAAAVIVGKKILKADKTRSLAVTGLAKGMKLQKDAKAAFQNMKDEASDICYDAKTEAGIRTVPMMEPVYNAFMEEYEYQKENGFSTVTLDGMEGFIFTNRFGNLHNPQAVNRTIKRIRENYNAEEILKAGKFPLLLGGEHLVTLAAVRAVAAKYPDLHIIHFDAHADLRDDYLGARLSHACVLRRCHDLLGDGRIHQFCIRSGEREEFRFAAQHTDFHPLSFDGLEETVKELKEKNVPIYFTIDLDCLDPAVFPGTGTPEAGGVTFLELLEAIRTVAQANVVGADVNELAPMLDASGVSTATACKVLRELLLAIAK